MILTDGEKIVVYTTIIGDYDKNIVKSTYYDPNIDIVVFTDNKTIRAKDEKIVLVDKTTMDNSRYSRLFKINPHLYFKNYKYSLWLDGHISIIGNIREMINNNISNDIFTGIAFLQHPNRNCLYREALECVKQHKDRTEIIQTQIDRYIKEGMPNNNGLIRGGVIFREHNNPTVIKIMENWWYEVLHGSKRDQISFNYVIWKLKAEYNEINKKFYTMYFKQHGCHHINK